MPRRYRPPAATTQEFDAQFSHIRMPYIARRYLKEMDIEAARQQASRLPIGHQCPHCGANDQWWRDDKTLACLTCGYRYYE